MKLVDLPTRSQQAVRFGLDIGSRIKWNTTWSVVEVYIALRKTPVKSGHRVFPAGVVTINAGTADFNPSIDYVADTSSMAPLGYYMNEEYCLAFLDITNDWIL